MDWLNWVAMKLLKVSWREHRMKSVEKIAKNGKRKGIMPVPKTRITRV